MITLTLLMIIAAAAQQVDAFASQDRRSIIKQIVTASVAVVSLPSSPANASLEKSSPDVPAFAGGIAEAKERFLLAVKDVDDLLNNYDAITSKGGGDSVRLYLGTQGIKSHMYGILKVLKSLKEEADDIVEYSEAMDSFEAYKNQAEGAAYQSMFVEHSSAKGTPASLLKTAKGDIVNLRKYMGDIAAQLHLEM